MASHRYPSHDWNRHRRARRGWRLPKVKLSRAALHTALLVASLAVMAGSLFALGLFAFVSRDLPDPKQLTERSIPETTQIFDRTGEHLLYEIFGAENRKLVKLQEAFCQKGSSDLETDAQGIPLYAVQATIAAEDRKFCTHGGFSVTGLLRAVAFGGSRGGGSTLTQQLVKNAILSNERTLTRKAKELILSLELERRYGKDEILQIYFNEIPYGSTYYGLQAASTNFFGKDVKDLTLAESATLAGLPQVPTFYINNPDRLRVRRDWILNTMAELGFVSEEEAEAAKKEDTPLRDAVTDITAPHFVFYVKEQLEETYGQRAVEEGGLKVITTLDFDKQAIAEEEVKRGVEERGKQYSFTNAALVAEDPKTGQILAMVGSKDYFDDAIHGKVNVATRARQPGSSFKPVVYGKGFEMGYSPSTVLWDVNTTFPTATGDYSPKNYDLGERGPIRVREALQGSLNIPAVKMSALVSVPNTLDFAERLGYTTLSDRSRFGLSIVLGGAEVKLIEHVGAYATFAREGVRLPQVSILKVEDAQGKALEEWKPTEGAKAMDAEVARTVSDVLSDNAARAYVFGPNNALTLGSRPAAAKTGTTNDYHDGWTLGYVPQLAAGVWTGNNDNAAMARGADGSKIAAPIWNAFMKRALEGTPVETFAKPTLAPSGKRVLDGELPGTTVTVDKATGKLATDFTPPSMREQRTYAEYHEILHYVDPADPRGAAPSDPGKHPQYAAWEAGVADWIARKEAETGIKVTNAVPPVEYDDVHVPGNFPSVTVESPGSGSSLSSRAVEVAVNAFAPRGINRVEIYLDGFFLGMDDSAPYLVRAALPGTVGRGFHTLKAVAYDDVDNSGSDTVGINVDSEAEAGGFDLLDPKNGQTIERAGATFPVAVTLQDPGDYRLVSVSAKRVGTADVQPVGSKADPSSPFVTFDWTLPGDGDWILTASAVRARDGVSVDTPGVTVHVTSLPGGIAPPTGEPTTPSNLDPFKP